MIALFFYLLLLSASSRSVHGLQTSILLFPPLPQKFLPWPVLRIPHDFPDDRKDADAIL